MKNSEMKAELDRANGLLVEKLGKQPYLRLSLELHDSGKWSCGGAYVDSNMRERISGKFSDTPEGAFKAIFQLIDKIPDPETKAKQAWQGKLGKVIDEGHALNLPDEVMSPLRQGSQAMTENLLAAPESSQ